MKIASWNVNSLTARLPHVLRWLAENPVDVLCLQELKMTADKFPHEALAEIGYAHCAVHGQKTYNGVALISRAPLANAVAGMDGFADDAARVLSADIDAPGGPLRLINGYFVNGQEPGSEKFAYKMRWLDAMQAHVARALAGSPRVVLLGDFNVTPDDRDSYDPEGLRETIHHTSEERAHFSALIHQGLVDAFRMFDHPPKTFSWWDYRMLGFQKNRGLRIDHILVSEPLRTQVVACEVDRAPRKWEKPSDHSPVVLTLGGAPG